VALERASASLVDAQAVTLRPRARGGLWRAAPEGHRHPRPKEARRRKTCRPRLFRRVNEEDCRFRADRRSDEARLAASSDVHLRSGESLERIHGRRGEDVADRTRRGSFPRLASSSRAEEASNGRLFVATSWHPRTHLAVPLAQCGSAIAGSTWEVHPHEVKAAGRR
jgi:hypothetical protein